MRNEKRGIQIGLGASSIFMIFVVLCMMILSVLSYTRALQNEKIAQREKLYQEAYARSDTGAQLLVNEMRQHADLRLEQLLKLEQVVSCWRNTTWKRNGARQSCLSTYRFRRISSCS